MIPYSGSRNGSVSMRKHIEHKARTLKSHDNELPDAKYIRVLYAPMNITHERRPILAFLRPTTVSKSGDGVKNEEQKSPFFFAGAR